MLLRSFAYWLAIAVSLLVLAGFLLFGAWVGWFGPVARDVLHEALEPAFKYYRENQEGFQIAFRVVGLLGTLATGLYTIYKAWYFAERNLPRRLIQYIENARERVIIDERNVVLAEVKAMGRPALQRLESDKPEVERVLAVLTRAKESWDKQFATLHYAHGTHDAMEADRVSAMSEPGLSAAALRARSIMHFEKAAQRDPSDARALELAALQSEKNQERKKAAELFKALADFYKERQRSLQQATALCSMAENTLDQCEGNITATSKLTLLRTARSGLGEVRLLLQGNGTDEAQYLLGRCDELLGRAKLETGALPSAKALFERALNAYASLARSEDVERIRRLLAESATTKIAPAEDDQEEVTAPLAIARAFENLGTAYMEGEDYSALKAARKYLVIARGMFEELDPPPNDDIARVKEKIDELS